MESTKTAEAILEQLRELREASASELAIRLGITPSGMRYQLNHLVQVGWVEVAAATTPHASSSGNSSNTGRPARRYRLAITNRPSNLAGLSLALLRLRKLSPEELNSLATQLAPNPSQDGNMLRRLTLAVEQLNKLKYAAAWEAGRSGPRLLLHNCPYLPILDAVPQLCALDQALLHRLLGVAVKQTARADWVSGAPAECVFECLSRTPSTLQTA